MNENLTFGEKILRFNENLLSEQIALPEGYSFINPYSGEQKEKVRKVARVFYEKYYNDTRKRYLILGSSPARRGSAITGVPFEDAQDLQKETGVLIDKFFINKRSSDFLSDVIIKYGGRKKFYNNFYMNFVCPIGVIRINSKGKEVNCNYYENSKLREALNSFIIKTIRYQIDFGIDTSVCYCIGSGENYKYLSKINNKNNFFEKIIPLEHPRFIMQYNSGRRSEFLYKYLNALNSY